MNTTEFIARVRDAAKKPDNDEDFTDAVILASGSENLRERYSTVLQNRREGYWLHRETVAASSTTNEYRIPPRAIAAGLEKVEISYTGTTWSKLNPVFDSDAGLYDSTSPGYPNWFSLEADYVRIYPMPDTSCQIRFSYALRPSRLRALSALGTVVSAPTSSTIRVSGGDPASLLGASGTVDVVNTTGSNEVALVGLPFSSIASAGGGNYDITITGGASLTRVAAGQVVRPADQTDYIPLPVELHDSLVRRVAGMWLIECGDEQGNTLLAAAEASIKRFQETAPRVKGSPFKVKSGRSTYLRRRYG